MRVNSENTKGNQHIEIGKRISSIILITILIFLAICCTSALASTHFIWRKTDPGTSGTLWEPNVSTANPYPYWNGNCTWYAFGRLWEVSGTRPPVIYSDAGDWYSNAPSYGYNQLSQDAPRVGAIACWGGGTYGHVAFVEAVNSNRSIVISESNWGGAPFGFRTIDPYVFEGLTFYGYIYYAPFGDFTSSENSNSSFDVNFIVDGAEREYIDGIGNISVYVGGQVMTYQDKQHSSATTSYSDFCRSVPGGQAYDVCIRITNPDYWCAGTTVGSAHGTTSGTISITFDIRSSKPSASIPDGDYMIVAAGYSDKSAFQYLDIQGSAVPASDHDNVALCGPYSSLNPPSYEIWTVSYDQSSGFYKIKQKDTNMCLDIVGDGAAAGANAQVFADNTQYYTHCWIIEQNGSDGYRIRARNSGQVLDIDGAISNGTNVQQWPQNGSDAQKWLFIPFNPSQPVDNGEYVLLYGGKDGYELDVPGDTGDIANSTQVQIWDNNAQSQYNSFEFIKLSNGYYKIKHIASGKCLDVTDGLSKYKSKVAVFDDNNSITQQWAVIENGTGYSIISRCNGYSLDLPGGMTNNGTGVEVYPRLTNDHQRWLFVNAEYDVSYNLDGGTDGPDNQTCYFRAVYAVSSVVPKKIGHTFVRWEAMTNDGTILLMQPGEKIVVAQNLELKAIWKANNYTLSYNGNGGSPVPASQSSNGAAVTIPSDIIPSRSHYYFRGWAESASAAVAEYAPGDSFSKGVSTTLYAVWEHSIENILVLPEMLTEIEEEAFINTNADAVIVPKEVSRIGNNAFGDVVIYGYAGTAANTYATQNGLKFVPITDGWVLESDVPNGAKLTGEEKWTYTLTTTETTTSIFPSMDGWTQTGFEWQRTGAGTWKYASYPSGFDTGSNLYIKYNKSALAAGESSTGETTKRVVDSGNTFVTYIYWHWTFVDALNEGDTNSNVLVEDAKKYNVLSGNVYRDYVYFDAFEDDVDHGTWGPGSSGQINVAPMRYAWRNDRWDVSHWWWIFDVRQQTYTDYQKLFTYVKDESEILESDTVVTPGDGITNVQHWVKYAF